MLDQTRQRKLETFCMLNSWLHTWMARRSDLIMLDHNRQYKLES